MSSAKHTGGKSYVPARTSSAGLCKKLGKVQVWSGLGRIGINTSEWAKKFPRVVSARHQPTEFWKILNSRQSCIYKDRFGRNYVFTSSQRSGLEPGSYPAQILPAKWSDVLATAPRRYIVREKFCTPARRFVSENNQRTPCLQAANSENLPDSQFKSSKLCGAHFVKGKHSQDPNDAETAPTILHRSVNQEASPVSDRCASPSKHFCSVPPKLSYENQGQLCTIPRKPETLHTASNGADAVGKHAAPLTFRTMDHDYVETVTEARRKTLLEADMLRNESMTREHDESPELFKSMTVKTLYTAHGHNGMKRKRQRAMNSERNEQDNQSVEKRFCACRVCDDLKNAKTPPLAKASADECRDGQTPLADLDQDSVDQEISKIAYSPSPTSGKQRKGKRRRKRLSMYGGKSKLQRNPPEKHAKPTESACLQSPMKIKEEPLDWDNPPFSSSMEAEKEESGDSYEKEMMQSLYAMQKSGKLCDFKILVSSLRSRRKLSLQVHRVVFSAVSSKVKLSRGSELDAVDSMNIINARKIVEFVYTGMIEGIKLMPVDDMRTLRAAANYLEIPKCVRYIDRIRNRKVSAELDEDSIAGQSEPASFIPPPMGVFLSFSEDDFEDGGGTDSVTTDTSDEEVIPRDTVTLPPLTRIRKTVKAKRRRLR